MSPLPETSSDTPRPPRRSAAVIDLGSNSARVVIMNYRPAYSYHIDNEIREVVRLRQGMTGKGLSKHASERAFHTLRLFKHFTDAVKADDVIATATSAVREAANGAEFVARVEQEMGLRLRILTGQEEAYYGVVGVLNAIELNDGVVLDIGGGSIQLSIVKEGRFVRGQALSLGALALTERFVNSDPITRKEIKRIQKEINAQLDTLPWMSDATGMLVGVGGTIRNLARMEAYRTGFPLQRIGGFTLTRLVVQDLVELLANFSVNQRQSLPGLKNDRADIILAGALVLQTIMERYHFEAVQISPNGLREGLFFERFWAGQAYPVPTNLRDFSVLNLARFYGYHEAHADTVKRLATALFDALQPLHQYETAARDLLGYAAILHDIGTAISYNDHHKHGETLIVSGGLPGFTPRETALIALLTRYHRKGTPSSGIYDSLMSPGDERLLTWLSALLRLAEYLERGRNGNVYDVTVELTDNSVTIQLHASEYPFVEIWESERNALDLMRVVCGRDVKLVATPVPANVPLQS